MRHKNCHFTHRFAKFGTIPLQMNPKNVHFQSSKDQEWRSLSCVSRTLQRRSFCKTMLPNRTPCKTMLPIESAEGPRSQRKRPLYALCDTIVSHKAYNGSGRKAYNGASTIICQRGAA